MRGLILPILLLCAMLADGCATASRPIDHPSSARNQGYTLMFELCVKNVGSEKLLLIKRVPPQIATEVKELAQVFRDAQHELETFKLNDPSLDYQAKSLPEIEENTR